VKKNREILGNGSLARFMERSEGVSEMKENFAEALRLTLKYEGGFSNDPHDPGGATMQGVTQGTYNIYRHHKNLPVQSVRLIGNNELQEIYKINYWDEVGGDALQSGVDALAFDIAVNSGPGRVRPWLAASKDMSVADRIHYLDQRRRSFYKGLSTFWRFGRGWMARENDLLSHAVYMANNSSNSAITRA
jgi:lysozyme family protein